MVKLKKGILSYVEDEYKDLLDELRNRYKDACEVYQDMDDLYESDNRFRDPNKQWPDEIRSQREGEGRPCLTVDRINPFVHQVCNEQRQSRPQPQVSPVGDGADKDTAEILQGMIRHISYMSNGDTAIDTAFECMVAGGWGFIRVLTDYQDETSFDQDIFIKRIPNPKDVRLDPSFTEPDGSDAEWATISTWLPRAVFRDEYPDAMQTGFTDSQWEDLGSECPEWAAKDGSACLVVEYFKRVRKPTTIYKLTDGTVTEDKPTDPELIDTQRVALKPVVIWHKCTALEVLDSTEWPGKYIPIIPILGTELIAEGKRTWAGLIRSAQDAQRAYNHWKSVQAETITLAPKAPYIGPKGFAGSGAQRGAWTNANKRAVAFLEYEPQTVDGQPVAPPHRDMAEPPVRAITEAMVGAVDDLKASTGMYDPSLGNRESSQSGVAIRQLQRQGATGNYHFQDNLARSIRHLGRVLIDLMPKIYDTQRTTRIIKPDDSAETVTVNGPSGTIDKETGMEKIYRLDVGRYDVAVSVGPSYQTRRQENLALLESLMQTPFGQMLTTVAPDLVVGMMDFAVAPQLVERIKKAMDPKFLDDDKGKQGQQLPPQIQQRLQQQDQMIQQLTQAVHAAHDQLDAKTQETDLAMRKAQLEADTKKQVAMIQAEAGIEEAKMKAMPGDPMAAQMIQQLQEQYAALEGVVINMHQALAAHPALGPVGQQMPPDAGAPPQPQGAPPVPMASPDMQPLPGTVQQQPNAIPNGA